ncbi:MAG: hypothetical protein SPI63_01355 [Bulleidia sp.]|nr:hypothetical protein [Bulleidia sp.]
MSENNKNGFDDLNKTVTDFVNKATKAASEATQGILSKIDLEKQKAEIRSEIGHHSRELSKYYETLGRNYYNDIVTKKASGNYTDVMDNIRTKEKLIELLNEKLDTLEK